jgi:hypothetical protein
MGWILFDFYFQVRKLNCKEIKQITQNHKVNNWQFIRPQPFLLLLLASMVYCYLTWEQIKKERSKKEGKEIRRTNHIVNSTSFTKSYYFNLELKNSILLGFHRKCIKVTINLSTSAAKLLLFLPGLLNKPYQINVLLKLKANLYFYNYFYFVEFHLSQMCCHSFSSQNFWFKSKIMPDYFIHFEKRRNITGDAKIHFNKCIINTEIWYRHFIFSN